MPDLHFCAQKPQCFDRGRIAAERPDQWLVRGPSGRDPGRRKGDPERSPVDHSLRAVRGVRVPWPPHVSRAYCMGVAPAGAPDWVTATTVGDWKIVPPWFDPKNRPPAPAVGLAPTK